MHRPVFLVTLIACGIIGSTIVSLRAAPTTAPTTALKADASNLRAKDVVATASKPAHLLKTANLQQQVLADAKAASDLEKSIREVFRTHGLKAELTTLEQGRIVLRTSTAETDTLARAEAAANADVYGLVELNVINKKPVVPEVMSQPVHPVVDPGQAIRLIIFGNPSYVITEDESRYFPGAQLPTGHRIESILKNKVILQKNGVTTELLL